MLRLGSALFAARPDDDDFSPQRSSSFELVFRSIRWHDDDGPNTQRPSRIRHALRVVSAGIGNHSAASLAVAEGSDLVVGAAQFEGTDRLQVLELKKELAMFGRVSRIRRAACGGRRQSAGLERRECR